jgi:hypothetical protein
LGHGDWEDHNLRPTWAKKVKEIPCQPVAGHNGHPSNIRKHKQNDGHPAQPRYKVRPFLKNTNMKRVSRVAQVVEHLPSTYKALSSTPSPPKKQKTKQSKQKNPDSEGNKQKSWK